MSYEYLYIWIDRWDRPLCQLAVTFTALKAVVWARRQFNTKNKAVKQDNTHDRIEKSHLILFTAVNFCIRLICLCLVCNTDSPLSFTLLLDFELSPCHITVFVYACTLDYSMSLFVFDCLHVCTYVCIHACRCQLQRTSGRHYIIWGPRGVLNVDTAWSSCLRQQECQHVGEEPLLEQNPAARKPLSRDKQQGQPARQLSPSSSLQQWDISTGLG